MDAFRSMSRTSALLSVATIQDGSEGMLHCTCSI
jgi:hypothetical protein